MKSICIKIDKDMAYEILNELQRMRLRVKWLGTGFRPATDIPYRKFPSQIEYLCITKNGVLQYHSATDDTMEVMDKDEFLKLAKSRHGK